MTKQTKFDKYSDEQLRLALKNINDENDGVPTLLEDIKLCLMIQEELWNRRAK